MVQESITIPPFNSQIKSRFLDVRCLPEFCFKQITYHHEQQNVYLGLFFQPWLSKKQSVKIRPKYRIIERFFDITLPNVSSVHAQELVDGEEENEAEDTTNNISSMPSVSKLYAMLRDAHEKDDDNRQMIDHVSLPICFVPELRSYQSKALHWMLKREHSIQYSMAEFVPIQCHNIPNKSFYFNYRTVELMDYNPGSLKIPTGGILADEMGLGKTVEMLALILTNQNLKRKLVERNSPIEAGNINIK